VQGSIDLFGYLHLNKVLVISIPADLFCCHVNLHLEDNLAEFNKRHLLSDLSDFVTDNTALVESGQVSIKKYELLSCPRILGDNILTSQTKPDFTVYDFDLD